MAHYTAYVLVSGSTIYVRGRVHYLMRPYHNDFEVEEYETECDCNWNRQAFDPDCEHCGGTGRYLTTFNPMCKLDEYVIWDSTHVLRNASKDPSDWEDEVVPDDDVPDDGYDEKAIAPLSSLDIDRLKLPFAIVTPSGEWYEMEGNWWSEDKESAEWKEWRSTVKEIYQKYPNAILVVLRCHQ